MSRKGVLSLREIIGYTEQILRALEHAHAKGIVHRDIKPQNIMLLKNGIVKVTDFGIAKLPNAETVTMTDKAIGTVYYISPEQASGNAIDARSDIYSLGVLMYEMATGKLPFTADSPVSVALMQINESATSPREINTNIPKGLEQIIKRAIEKSPEMRYPSAALMMRNLMKLKENPNAQFKSPKKTAAPKKKIISRTMFPIILGVVLPFLIVAGISATLIITSILSNSNDTTETMTVTNFVGQKYSDELKQFFDTSEYYKLTLNYVYSNEHEADKIISQSPEAGETRRVNKGKKFCEITLTVSQGPRYVQMPDVRVFDHIEAKILINSLFSDPKALTVVEQREESDVYEIGTIIYTVPAAGETLESGDTIYLHYSGGPSAPPIVMPDFVGMNEGEVLQGLFGNKLLRGDVTYTASDKPEGTILSQSHTAGDEIPVYTIIDFTVSGGKDYGKTEETTVETEIDTETETETEPVTETETETETEPVTEPDTETESDKETEPDTETEPIIDSETEPVVIDTETSDESDESESDEPVVNDTTAESIIDTEEPVTIGVTEAALPVDDEEE